MGSSIFSGKEAITTDSGKEWRRNILSYDSIRPEKLIYLSKVLLSKGGIFRAWNSLGYQDNTLSKFSYGLLSLDARMVNFTQLTKSPIKFNGIFVNLTLLLAI